MQRKFNEDFIDPFHCNSLANLDRENFGFFPLLLIFE
jgi:hypothetical protein